MRCASSVRAGRDLRRGRRVAAVLTQTTFSATRTVALVAAILAGGILGGCSSVPEIKSLRTSGQMTDADRKKMGDAFAAQNQKVANEQTQWRIDPPAEAAKRD